MTGITIGKYLKFMTVLILLDLPITYMGHTLVKDLLNFMINQKQLNKPFESSQKLLKSSFVNERFKKYSMLPNELLTFETTNFTKT